MTGRRPAKTIGQAEAPTDFVCACATSRHVARLLTQLYDGFLRGTGLESPQFALMMALEKLGESNQIAIGRRYALDKTTVSRNLKLLAARGWIESRAGKDRRERLFTLTTEGRKRLAVARPRWHKAQGQLRAAMTGAEWRTMFDVFRRLTHAAHSARGSVPQIARR